MVMVMKLPTRWTCATRMPESHKCGAMFDQNRKHKGLGNLAICGHTNFLKKYDPNVYLWFLGPRDSGDGDWSQRVLQVCWMGHPWCSCSQVTFKPLQSFPDIFAYRIFSTEMSCHVRNVQPLWNMPTHIGLKVFFWNTSKQRISQKQLKPPPNSTKAI